MRTAARIFIIAITFVLMFFRADAQTLSLDDIIEVRKMDSTQFKLFSDQKGFQLKRTDVDAWRTSYEYQSISDSSIRILKSFPTGKQLNLSGATSKPTDNPGMVYYYFADRSFIKDFKKEMKAKKFKYHRSDTTNHGGNIFIHIKYRTNEDEIDLASEQIPGYKISYALMYYRRPN